ncbi:uncharacterized protein brk [Chelonus insularis]|uniref:uncharacterized protein brk n=1 Tax=Chelonus insularis TaxID=460826 RepID=UPI00158BD8E7|nr:uncharacterized protein LOC118074824 [Chelonus insularis]
MAHSVGEVLSESASAVKMVNQHQKTPNNNNNNNISNNNNNINSNQQQKKAVGVMGSRRIFPAAFKLKVLDSYRNDIDCRGNQRATARKYGIHRRQIQKWLQCEDHLRNSCAESANNNITTPTTTSGGSLSTKSESSISGTSTTSPGVAPAPALNLSLARLHGDELVARPPPHLPSNSPTPAQYHQTNPMPVHTLLLGYSDQHHPTEDSTDHKYYVLNHSNYEQVSGYRVGNDGRLYQHPSLSYQSSAVYNGTVSDHQLLGASVHQTGHVILRRDLPGNELPAIKAERASPDSSATSGPCNDIPNSPDINTNVRLIYQSSQHVTNGNVAVHFEAVQPSPEPHVHINVDAHAFTSNSEKSNHERELESKKQKLGMKEDGLEYCEPKEEILDDQEEVTEREASEGSERSGPSSPRGGTSISSRSTSSCSDSEMDPLDYSSGPQQAINDFSRRRSFSLRFKLNVLDAFHSDVGVAGNQRATARKFGINRRQVQKWLGQESELRGEIALRGGDMRQRLGALQETPGESPVDLTTASGDLDQSSSPLYCCESSSQQLNYYPSTPNDSDALQRTCTLSCCAESLTNLSNISQNCYPESHTYYCYSPKESIEPVDNLDSSSLKRNFCTLNCCYEALPPSKRICLEPEEPQDTPLCLVKPKHIEKLPNLPVQTEPVTSTVPTPPSVPASKKDVILFKPYLDNPISKPVDDSSHHRENSPISNHSIIANNNNCTSICNLNEERGHDYALELSLRVPVSWRYQPYSEFPEGIRSAFVRYPTSSHHI